MIAKTARIAASAHIGPNAVIGDRSIIGENVYVGPGSVIGPDCVIADDSKLIANVTLTRRVRIGLRGIVHPGVVIAADGFGNAKTPDGWVICDDVVVSGKGMISKDINEPGVYASNFPAEKVSDWNRRVAHFRRLDRLLDRIAKLEKAAE